MTQRPRSVDIKKHVARAFVLSGLAFAGWYVIEKPRIAAVSGQRLMLASAEADLVEANVFAAAAAYTTPVLAAAERELAVLESWAGTASDEASSYSLFRSLATTRDVTIERLEPGSSRAAAKPSRDARTADVAAFSLDVVGPAEQVVGFICDVDSKIGAGKVTSFRIAPLPGRVTGRVRATLEIIHLHLSEDSPQPKAAKGAKP